MILLNADVIVWRQTKRENSSLPVAVRVSKARMLKLARLAAVIHRSLSKQLLNGPLWFHHNTEIPRCPKRCYFEGILTYTESSTIIFAPELLKGSYLQVNKCPSPLLLPSRHWIVFVTKNSVYIHTAKSLSPDSWPYGYTRCSLSKTPPTTF